MQINFDYNPKSNRRAFFIAAFFVIVGATLIFLNHGVIGSAIFFFAALKLMEVL